MKKKLFSIALALSFILTGCIASVAPRPVYVKRPAYVYYDNLYGTYVYMPYKMRIVSNRYIYHRHIPDYRGKYKLYKRNIRFYKPKIHVNKKNPHKKIYPKKKCCPH